MSCLRSLLAAVLFFYSYSSFAASAPVDPVAQALQAYYTKFPKLPPSNACKPEDAQGSWKLAVLYEVPADAQTKDISQFPNQYLVFSEYNQLAEVKDKAPRSVEDLTAEIGKELKQYIVTSSGILYQYKNSVLEKTWLCRIAAAPKEQNTSQMLLMPLENEVKPRLVKIYESMLKPIKATEEK